ncbi:MAG: diguanylate cyclase [Alphaproteobacteria bacterium]|nr:diguanylate cyclase [Alphaproteobacteria bacterium]
MEKSLSGAPGIALAHETVDLLAGHEIIPTPENYEVWLNFRMSRNRDLTQAIESRIEAGLPFTADINAQLHERFFANPRNAAHIVAASERIARDLQRVVGVLQASQARTDAYGRTLEDAAERLTTIPESNRLSEIIAALSAATVDMASHNRSLTEQLQHASRDVESLRASLATVRTDALTDGLTGLANRRMFDDTLAMRVSEAHANAADLCLVMCDVDHFKRFNDTWGHQTGDQILRFVASTMSQFALPDHLVARYGGEEFAMIMPRTGLSAARSIAESLRAAIHGKRLRRRSTNEDLGQVTVSFGVSRLQPGEKASALVDRCDGRLYASKRAGRNRVTADEYPNLHVA